MRARGRDDFALHRTRRARAAVSLLLALSLGVLQCTTFHSGYFVSRGIGDRYSTHPGQFFLMVNRGSLSGGWQSTFVEPAHWQAYPIDPFPQGRFGFAAYFSSRSWTLGVPLWLLA